MFSRKRNEEPSLVGRPAPPPVAPPPVERSVGSAFVLERNKPAVISEAFTILGDVVGTGVLHVEGKVVGNVRTDSVSISTTGRVEGAIECGSLQVKGQLHGACNCDELTVATGASVSGKLKYKSIAVSRGAKIEGDMNLPETVALPAPHGDPAGETSVQGPQSNFGETSNANVLSAETTHATTHA
ncbi:MAG: polymer-forming cytoskeletal protein [Betaproteobacteria bacterium]|nr:polymer-forming cytoskeletal protein [Betaproteobacteria bacterium]